jgi:LPXTG-site transpeptidase (sortase) family protein
MTRAATRRLVERSLFAIAAVCLGTWAAAALESAIYDAVQGRRLDTALVEGSEVSGPSTVATVSAVVPGPTPRRKARPAPDLPNLIGRVEIPRLGLRVLVGEGIDSRTLRRAAGHVPGTARPGEPGNVAIAGHRDRAFAPLRGVREGDLVTLQSPSGRFDYEVEWTAVVSPDRGDLLDPTDHDALTLVTCHPFFVVGPAPERFVVRARALAR